MKYYLIAGEASGDLHGSNLMKELKKQDPQAEFRFWGGDRMAKEGGDPVKHIRDLAFMGFIEVVANLRTILGNMKMCKKDVLAYQPDALILIDYPGFNMRIAEFAHENGIQVHYYISPQVWAWKQNRVYKLKQFCNEMYCILPFEKEFYQRFDFEVNFVGHPLVDAIQQFRETAIDRQTFIQEHQLDERPILALLPGSRQQEIKIKLPIMLKAAEAFTDHQVLIAGAPTMDLSFYRQFSSTARVIENKTYDLLNHANMAMVTSGTATLETALFNVPQVVCYKGSAISYQIAKRLVKVDYISLVNLIAGKELVTELIQNDLTPKNIIRELKKLEMADSPERKALIESYRKMEERLGGGGASAKTASLMIENIRKSE